MQRWLARNVIWNLGGTLTHLLVGFVVMRYLVRELGPTIYGLWILIASLSGYFSVLDLGISGSVARNLAFHRSRDDIDGANRVLSTSLALLLGVAVITAAATIAVLAVFFRIIEVAPLQIDAVRAALLIVGLNLALSFPLGIFSGVLWAHERFDLQNRIDMPVVVTRAVLSVWWVEAGGGLVALAVITLATSLGQGVVKAWFCWRVEPRMRFAPRFLDAATARGLFGYGFWYFLLSLSRTITPQISPTLVGARLGAALVTALRIPMQLTTYANSFLIAGTQVLTPVATGHHATEKADEQRRLFLDGGKYSLMLALGFGTLFGWLGEPLIRLWIGAEYAYTWQLLMILSLGELLPMSQWVSYSIILGMGKHKMMAILSLAENTAALALTWYLMQPLGLAGACIAIAAPGMISRGLCQWLYCCRLVGVSPWQSWRRSFVPTLALALPSAALLGAWTWWIPVDCWFDLFLAGAVYGVAFLVSGGLGLVGIDRCRSLLGLGDNTDSLATTGPNAS